MNKTNNGHFVIMYSNWGKEREREREREREKLYTICVVMWMLTYLGQLKDSKRLYFIFNFPERKVDRLSNDWSFLWGNYQYFMNIRIDYLINARISMIQIESSKKNDSNRLA